VLSGILASTEFYNRAQTLVPSGSADQRYVAALYQLVLSRAGDPAAVASWAALVPSQGRQAVASDFLTSPEYRGDQIGTYYAGLLHRTPSPADVNGWVFSNLDLGAVSIDFEASPEFFMNG